MAEIEERILVCNLTTTQKPNLTKAIVKQCADCGKDIWASISGIFQAGPHAKLICRDCFNSLEEEEIIVNMPTEPQIKQLMEYSGKSREEVIERCQSFCDEVERTGKLPY